MTIDDLAKMVAKGFEQTATKQDLLNLVTKEDLKKEMRIKLVIQKSKVDLDLSELDHFDT